GRNLIWALLCQAYMNDDERAKLCGKHGRDLVVDDGMRRSVGRMARSYVRPLLTWIAEESDHTAEVKNQKYGFLTTRNVFEQCMEVARKRWQWQHRRLGSCS